MASANLLPGLPPPAPLRSGNNERRRKTTRAVNCEFLTTFAVAAPQGPYLFRNRPGMPVSPSHVCFSGTFISTLEKLVAIIKWFYVVSFGTDGFTHTPYSRILVGEEILAGRKRPTLLFLCYSFLHGSWLLSVAREVTIANISFRQNIRCTVQKSRWRK